MVQCVICKSKDAEQKHHVCYDPELTIDVCVPCHLLMHKHGVGAATGQTRSNIEEEIIEEIPQLPTFTKTIEKEDAPYIVSIDDETVLHILNCRNGCTAGWHVLRHPETGDLFLRCVHCGWDTKVKRIG